MSVHDSDPEKNIKKGWFYAGLITIVAAVLLPFIVVIFSRRGLNINDIGELAAVGDFFGGSTVGLLSIASIFFIIHTISIQSRELSLQREELQMTRKELADTRGVHEESNKTQLTQRFETTFFNMLSLQNELINHMEVSKGGNQTANGREATTFLYKKFENYFRHPTPIVAEKVKNATGMIEKFYPVYDEFFNGFGDYLGPYFRNIEILIRLVQNNDFSSEEQKHYLDILRAQMSSSEIKLLFYNTASTLEYTDYEDLLINLNFFSGYLDPHDLLHVKHKTFLES